MSKDNKEGKKPPYAVGYGKPPAANRFRKGVSGNPAGRKVKVPDDLREAIRAATLQPVITIGANGSRKKMPKLLALYEKFLNDAFKSGKIRNLKDISGFLKDFGFKDWQSLMANPTKRIIEVRFVKGPGKPKGKKDESEE